MASRERLIVEAVIQALVSGSIAGIAGRIFEERGFSIDPRDMPAIDVTTGNSDPEAVTIGWGPLEHRLQIDVAVVVRQSLTESPSKVADPIDVASFEAIQSSAPLAALVESIRPGPVRIERQDTGDGVVLRRTRTWIVTHATKADDLESAP